MDDLTSKRPVNTGLKISDTERARRKKAIDYARGSVRLEGFVTSPDYDELNRKYIDGEITRTQLTAAVLARNGL